MRYVPLAFILTSLAFPSSAYVQKGHKKDHSAEVIANYTGPKRRIGVMDMEVKITSSATTSPTANGGSTTTSSVDIPMPTDFGTGLTEMLTTALVDSNRFVVLERKALPDIQAERTAQAAGGFDPASVAQKDRLLGAQTLIRGAVTEFSYRKSSIGGNGVFKKLGDVSRGQGEAYVALDIRFYSVDTGQVLDSVKAEGKAKSSATAFNFGQKDVKVGGSTFQESPLGEATRNAIKDAVRQICAHMEKTPWEARIAELDDPAKPTQIYVNAGSTMGVKVGDRFEFLKPGKEIIDPQTRLAIGRTKDHVCGHGKVESVTEGLAIVTVADGEGFAVGDVVRFVTATP